MSDPNQPIVDSTPEATPRDQLVAFFQASIGILGLIGFNVPPIASNLAVEQQVASALLMLAALTSAWYHRVKTKPAEVHAAAVASAAAGRAVRPV